MANYSATITGHGFAESKNTHTPSIKFALKATYDLDAQQPVDKTFYADLWLSDKAIENTCRTLREIGFNSDNMADLNDSQLMVGTVVEITTEWEDYNYNSYEKVKFMNAAGNYARRGVKPMDSTQAKKLAAKYNSALKNAQKRAPQHQPSPDQFGATQGNGAPEGDDDLPF